MLATASEIDILKAKDGQIQVKVIGVDVFHPNTAKFSAAVCRNGTFGLGPLSTSVYVGGIWQVEHRATPMNSA